MKKFVFALQVFGVMALFPIYVILEMNHGLHENKNHLHVIEKAEETTIQVSLNVEAQNENSIPGKILTGLAAPLGKNEIIKALAESVYNEY
jgi:hypothetical protein